MSSRAFRARALALTGLRRAGAAKKRYMYWTREEQEGFFSVLKQTGGKLEPAHCFKTIVRKIESKDYDQVSGCARRRLPPPGASASARLGGPSRPARALPCVQQSVRAAGLLAWAAPRRPAPPPGAPV